MNRLITVLCLFGALSVKGQGLPGEMYLSPDGRNLFTGGQQAAGFYDPGTVKDIFLTFPQANYWTLMLVNYNNKINIPATMVVDGITYDSVGVRFKGQTSFSQVSGQKKSFNIELDGFIPGQDHEGYNIFNLNNCYQDASFMHEHVYLQMIRKHIPAAKSSYVNLYINGQLWGIYVNVQQLNKDFYEEWFLSNDGTNWRADKPPGSGGGIGGGWGDGTAALNYLGADTSLYKPHYTLKSTNKAQPWNDLVTVCEVLDTVSQANMPSVLSQYLDIDRTLWHLATEIAWCDDDSYVYKGKMDYYVYHELETGRITPIEYDGNSTFHTGFTTSWTAFYHVPDVNYPLLNRIIANPVLRQRYLAHFRTLLNEAFDTSYSYSVIDNTGALIDPHVQADPKKIYTYTQFLNEKQAMRTFMLNRKNFLNVNAEVNRPSPIMTDGKYYVNNIAWDSVHAMNDVNVTTQVSSTNGISKMTCYYATGLVGNFTAVQMADDGLHNDGAAGDSVYGATIPGQPGGSWVRYYFEATAGDLNSTVSFYPAGAEHDVFIYQVQPSAATTIEVSINEVMASNLMTAADNAGEFDDWIEIYNLTSQPVDLSGFYLTDNELNLTKWAFPSGSIVQANDYLIVWADEDQSQGPLHASFKLSASGERIMLLNSNLEVIDDVTFGVQTTDMGYARVPNGTGNFTIQQATFNANNNLSTNVAEAEGIASITVYPNPASNEVMLTLNNELELPVEVFNQVGEIVYTTGYSKTIKLDTSGLNDGIYTIRNGNKAVRLVVVH